MSAYHTPGEGAEGEGQPNELASNELPSNELTSNELPSTQLPSNELATFLSANGLGDKIAVACAKAEYNMELLSLIDTKDELDGFMEDLSTHATLTNKDKLRLKKAIRKLTAGAVPATTNYGNTSTPGGPTGGGSRGDRSRLTEPGSAVVTRQQVEEYITKLDNHIKALESCKFLLQNKENQINKNKKESNVMIDEIFNSIINTVNAKRNESLNTIINGVFTQDCARIRKDLAVLEDEIHKCKQHKNDYSNVNSIDNESISQCLKFNISNIRDVEYKTDTNMIDVIYDNNLINSITSQIGSIKIDIESNNSNSDEYIKVEEYCSCISVLLDKISCFDDAGKGIKQLHTIKDIRMLFPSNLNAQNGCIVLGKHTEIYDMANNKNISKEKLELFYKNKCFFKQEMNKKAIFGARGKNIYLAIVTDIYNHFKIFRYKRLLSAELDKYINNNNNSKSLLYEFINNDSNSNNNRQLEKGQSLLVHIRNGQYRLTKEELQFLQYGNIDVGKGVANVRSTTLLLKLKEFEQSQIPLIQEKKAMIAMANSEKKDNSNSNDDDDDDDNKESVDVNELLLNVKTLRQREDFEVDVFRQINRSSLTEIETAIKENKIGFLEKYKYHKETMILCAKCQISMIKNKCIKSVINSCTNMIVVKELRRIMVCHCNPKEKYGFYVCKFKYDTSCPKYCSELEYLIDEIDAQIEILQAKMLE